MIVGVTGRIATGKTTVSKILGEKNFLRIDADKIYHELRKTSEPMKDELKKRFGSEEASDILKIVSDDKDALSDLNKITHKYVSAEIKVVLESMTYDDAVLDVPIPIKEGFLDLADFIIVTSCSIECQIDRIMERDDVDEGEALSKINLQMPDEHYCALGNLVINTEGMNESDLEKVVQKALDL